MRGGFSKVPVLTGEDESARLEKLPRNGRRCPGCPAALVVVADGVWVLFENSTVCFVCDSAKFFVWLRPFHIPVVGVAFLETASFGFVSLLGLCFS